MASSFPGAIDSFTDPLSTSPLSSPSHALQHQDINDAVEKVETYMGLVKVIPTSATNGTVGATGTVTIGNAVSSVSLNGAFSSLYNNYRVLIRIASASTTSDCNLRYRVGGVDNTALAYSWFYVGINNTAGSLNNASGGQSLAFTGTNVSTTGIVQTFELDFFSPFLAEETRTFGFGSQRAPGGVRVGGTIQTDATSFDGFTLLASAGTWTGGTITVYGYRN